MSKTESKSKSLFIRDLIRHVHQELLESRAEREASGQPAIFEVTNLVIEVNFVITESTEGKGGLNFKVITVGGVDVGGSKTYEQNQVQKITLTLTALPYKEEIENGTTTLKDLVKAPVPFQPY
jgi:hypothetical protein